jgi:hypothetical protein
MEIVKEKFRSALPFIIAGKIVLALIAGVLVFHTLIITGIIPFTIVWGGKLKTEAEMVRFEIISLSINIFLFLTVLMTLGYLRASIPSRIIRFVLWTFALLFLVNTIGNLFAETNLERWIFTPMTLVLSICCMRLALKDKPSKV